MHAQSYHGPHHPRARTRGTEYAIYFALIFAISLPSAVVRMAVPRKGQPRRFFLTEAWAMAASVTPRIFSA